LLLVCCSVRMVTSVWTAHGRACEFFWKLIFCFFNGSYSAYLNVLKLVVCLYWI
jgi:hypothetical protein